MGIKESASKNSQIDEKTNPKATRPHVPSVYGVPQADEGLLPWSYVTQRMTEAKCYWLSTVDAESQPYATPIDGLWHKGTLYFGGSPRTRWSRNLSQNPSLCVHLESGIDVVILRGEAVEMKGMERELAETLARASYEKYGYAPKPEEYENSDGVYAFYPRIVLAWQQFPQDATRWEIA